MKSGETVKQLNNDLKQVHIFVFGRVQGVFFRAWCKKLAGELGLNGWVRNLPDGQVEIVAEGKKDQLIELTRFLAEPDRPLAGIRKGPRLAKVENLSIEWKDAAGEFEDFTIEC